MKISKGDINHKVDKLVEELLRISDKEDQQKVDKLVNELICLFTIKHAIKIAHQTWQKLKEKQKKLKEKV